MTGSDCYRFYCLRRGYLSCDEIALLDVIKKPYKSKVKGQ